MHLRLLRRGYVFILLLALILGAQSNESLAEFSPEVDDTVKTLTELDEDKTLEAVKSLVTSDDPHLFALLQGLFKGEVFYDSKRKEMHGLIIIGDADYNDDMEEVAPLFTVYPTKAPLNGADEKQLMGLVEEIEEVPTNRAIRDTIQEYLTLYNLTKGDRTRRKESALDIGRAGDPKSIALLAKAMEIENDEIVIHYLHEATYLIQLNDKDSIVRLAAVEGLKSIKSRNTLGTLKAMITPDKEGVIPETSERVVAAIKDTLSTVDQWEFQIQIIQTFFNGISLGSILILMSLGLAIIYGLLGVINMAHGEFMMIGAYTAYVVQSTLGAYLGDGYFLVSLPISFLTAGLMGIFVEWAIIRHLYHRPLESLLATWGVSLILIQSARKIFGDLTSISSPSYLSGGIEFIPDVVFPYGRIFILGLTAVVMLMTYVLLNRTRMGMRIRAVTQNRNMASCLGVHTRRVDATAFFLGSGIAGIAGCCITLIGNIVPNMGQTYIVDSFLVVVTGGVGKLLGTIVSGMGLGVLNKLFEPFMGAVFGKVGILALVILFLQFRPTGIFPHRGRGED